MRHLSDDLVLSVKDAMRNLRYAIRSEAMSPSLARLGGERAPERHPRPAARGRSRMAQLVDSVFTEFEANALALVSPLREAPRGEVFPRPVTAYFGRGGSRSGDEAAERLFARVHYQAAKGLLRGWGLRNVLIFEHAIGRARDEMLKRHADLADELRDSAADGRATRLRLCAALTCTLVAARPIKEIDAAPGPSAPRGLAGSPNACCFLVLGLATAIASVNEPGTLPAAAEIVASANAVVDLRFGRFVAALEAEDPVEALVLEFEEVLPFLP